MKAFKLLFAVATFSSALVQAAETQAPKFVLIDEQRDSGQFLATSEYRYNASLDRAWVVISYGNRAAEFPGQSPYQAYTYVDSAVKILGLSFDHSFNQIVFEKDDERVVCANVQLKKVLWWKKKVIVPTGNCSFIQVAGVRSVDDGFTVHEETTLRVYFTYTGADPALN